MAQGAEANSRYVYISGKVYMQNRNENTYFIFETKSTKTLSKCDWSLYYSNTVWYLNKKVPNNWCGQMFGTSRNQEGLESYKCGTSLLRQPSCCGSRQ